MKYEPLGFTTRIFFFCGLATQAVFNNFVRLLILKSKFCDSFAYSSLYILIEVGTRFLLSCYHLYSICQWRCVDVMRILPVTSHF